MRRKGKRLINTLMSHSFQHNVSLNAEGQPRVLFLVEYDKSGEFARYAADVCRAWNSAAQQIVWMESGGPEVNEELFGDIPVESVSRFGFLGYIRLLNKLRALRPDCLVAIGARAGWFGIRAAQRAGVSSTLYVSLSDLIYRDRSLSRVARNYLVLTKIFRHANRIVVPSYGNRYQLLLREWVPEEKFFLLPKMFDPREEPAAAAMDNLKKSRGSPDAGCHVVYAGALNTPARLDWLLRAWALVEEDIPTARLTIVGNGPNEPSLQKQAQRLGLERCSIQQPQRPLIEYVATADMVAMTSLYELHARLLLMAMGYGKPIVAMEADGVRMSIRNDKEGLLVPVGDVKAFAAALIELLRDPERRAEMGRAGLRRITQFGRDSFDARALQLLSSLTHQETLT